MENTYKPFIEKSDVPVGRRHRYEDNIKIDRINFHLVPRSRMRGAIPPLPNMSSWCGA
jgi:hypothetical protein